jgi:threonine dehydratase
MHGRVNGEVTESDPRTTDAVTRDDIERAAESIGGHVRSTPVLEVPGREIGVDATLVFKLEYLQHSGSFKARGAAHFVTTRPIAADGIVAASGGNHGAAVAWAAQRFGHDAHIFVPTTATPAKVERLRGYGATVHEAGEVYGEAFAASRRYLHTHLATAIHAYDDPVVMAGAGTCARELDHAVPGLEAVVLACGGGGLAGSTAAWYGDRTEVVAVETTGTASYAAAVAAGEPVDVAVSGIAADALGAPRIGTTPFRSLRAAGATSVLVHDDDVLAARTQLWNWLRIVVEPAAATPLAALMSGAWTPRSPHDRIGIVLCGANTTLDLTPPPGPPPVTAPTR